MRALRDREFDPNLPLQTKAGTQQALRVGKSTVDDFISEGLLDVIVLKDSQGAPRITRVTTESIMRLIENRRRPLATTNVTGDAA
jgi:hypothetical protein